MWYFQILLNCQPNQNAGIDTVLTYLTTQRACTACIFVTLIMSNYFKARLHCLDLLKRFHV